MVAGVCVSFGNQGVFNFSEAVGSIGSRECRWMYVLESIYVYDFVVVGIGDEVGGGGGGVSVSLSIGSQWVFKLMSSNWSAILSSVAAVCVVR